MVTTYFSIIFKGGNHKFTGIPRSRRYSFVCYGLTLLVRRFGYQRFEELNELRNMNGCDRPDTFVFDFAVFMSKDVALSDNLLQGICG